MSVLPAGWRIVRLGEIARLRRGNEPGSKSYCPPTTGTRFLRVGDISGKMDNQVNTTSNDVILCKKPDVLMSFDGSPGIVARGFEGAISSGIRKIEPNEHDVSKDYLYFCLQSDNVQRTIKKYSVGETIIHASKAIPYIEIVLPPIETQHKIVGILERTEAIRRKREKATRLTENLIRSTFSDMFNPTRAERENWETWEVLDLALHVKGAIQSGPFGSDLHNRDFVKEGILAVGIDNVFPNKFIMGRGRHITKEKYDELKKFTARPGDVLVTVMGTVGRSCVFPASASPAIITKHVYRISLDGTKCRPEFLSSSINWDLSIRRQLGASTTGAIVDGLTSSSIKALKLRLPPIQKQVRFVDFLDRYTKIQAYQQKSSEEIDELHISTMQRVFKGELTQN